MSRKKSRKRIKIRGHYVQVRQRSTKKGKKGTIMGEWSPRRKQRRKRNSFQENVASSGFFFLSHNHGMRLVVGF